MEAEIIAIVIAGLLVALLLVVISIIFVIIDHKIKKKVLSYSAKISSLQKLNSKVKFHNVQKTFSFYKHYDNKRNYLRIQPAYLMMARLKGNIDFFADYIQKIKENRENEAQYKKQIKAILDTEELVDYSALKISPKTFKYYEEKLFSRIVITPVTTCVCKVEMKYSSPKKKVNLSKSQQFDFDAMFACFESISRASLEYDTYSKLVLVERGEVSDSMRYDIMQRDNFKCVICGASAQIGARLHVDHIVPVSKGGKSVPSNLRTLCERCNVGKSDKIESVDTQDIEESAVQNNDDVICERCGAKMVLRKGYSGEFYGCSNFPRCRNTKLVENKVIIQE